MNWEEFARSAGPRRGPRQCLGSGRRLGFPKIATWRRRKPAMLAELTGSQACATGHPANSTILPLIAGGRADGLFGPIQRTLKGPAASRLRADGEGEWDKEEC